VTNRTSGVVISQVYGGGGNAGSTFKNDFIELFNSSGATVTVDGWSVQYASAAGTTWQVTNLSGSIAPGQYYLVQESQGAGGTTALPTPNATGTIAMSATVGKVALLSSTTALMDGPFLSYASMRARYASTSLRHVTRPARIAPSWPLVRASFESVRNDCSYPVGGNSSRP